MSADKIAGEHRPKDSADQCLQLLRAGDRDLYLAWLMLPAATRPACIALAALHMELQAAARRAGDPMAVRLRLIWWCDAVATVLGTADAPGPHAARISDSPVLEALQAAVEAHDLPVARLPAMVAAHDSDPPPDLAALEASGAATTGAFLIAIQEAIVPVPPDPPVIAACEALGAAWTLLADLRHGRDPSPAPAERQCRRAAELLVEARRQMPEIPRDRRRGLHLAGLADHHLRRIEQAGYDVARARPPSPLRLVNLVWAGWRGRY